MVAQTGGPDSGLARHTAMKKPLLARLPACLIAGAVLSLATLSLAAADGPIWRSVQLEDAAFNARLVRDVEEITRLLGNDLDHEYILIELDVKPLYNSNIQLTRDDFVLRSYRDGDRSFAQSPDRIAGEAVLVLNEGRARQSGNVFSQEQTLGTQGGGVTPGVLGGGAGTVVETKISAERQQETTLVGRLQHLELAMGPTRAQVRGYLYFQLNPKNKPKHLVLNYEGSAGECKIPFK